MSVSIFPRDDRTYEKNAVAGNTEKFMIWFYVKNSCNKVDNFYFGLEKYICFIIKGIYTFKNVFIII